MRGKKSMKHTIHLDLLSPPVLEISPIAGKRWHWKTPSEEGHAQLIDLLLSFPALLAGCAGLTENLGDDHVGAEVRPWTSMLDYQCGSPQEKEVAQAMSLCSNRVLTADWPGIPVRLRAAAEAQRLGDLISGTSAQQGTPGSREIPPSLRRLEASRWAEARRRLLNGRAEELLKAYQTPAANLQVRQSEVTSLQAERHENSWGSPNNRA